MDFFTTFFATGSAEAFFGAATFLDVTFVATAFFGVGLDSGVVFAFLTVGASSESSVAFLFEDVGLEAVGLSEVVLVVVAFEAAFDGARALFVGLIEAASEEAALETRALLAGAAEESISDAVLLEEAREEARADWVDDLAAAFFFISLVKGFVADATLLGGIVSRTR